MVALACAAARASCAAARGGGLVVASRFCCKRGTSLCQSISLSIEGMAAPSSFFPLFRSFTSINQSLTRLTPPYKQNRRSSPACCVRALD